MLFAIGCGVSFLFIAGAYTAFLAGRAAEPGAGAARPKSGG